MKDGAGGAEDRERQPGDDTPRPAEYAETLRQWAARARHRMGPRGAEGPEDVEAYLEELQVAEEELQVQADEMEAALAEAESQRRRYRELFENAPLPYLTTDGAGKILEANRAAKDLLGLDAERIAGKPLPLYLTGESDLRGRIARLAAGRSVQPWESAIRPRRGREVPVEVSARVATPGGGEGTEIRWVIQDVRARRHARERERELHREQAARSALEQVAGRARFLSEASAQLMGVLDPPKVWQRAAELAGAQTAAAILMEPVGDEGVRVRGVGGTGESRRDVRPLLGRVLEWRDGSADSIPLHAVRLVMTSGEAEVVSGPDDPPDAAGSCVVVPLRSPDRTLGVMAVWLRPGARIGEELLVARNLADRTAVALEAAAMFQEVVRARREAEEANTAESDFLSVVSHELRTPLTAIVSYAELLTDRAAELPEKLERYAHQIAAAAEHQRQLVQQILAYKQVQRNAGLEPEELDYRKVARSAVAMVQPQVGEKPVALEYDVPAVPVQGVADRGKLQQILTNLLSNAIRHTDEGEVRLILETQHQWVVFRVRDTGEGIPEEDRARIFDRFWRGGAAGGRRGGSGLGLTITRELVDRMLGQIEVESQPRVGTTFTVRIPRVAVEGRE